jgi:hypothetical protein
MTISNILKIIVCGDRNWKDKAMIKQYIASLPSGTLIIQGECKGADLLAKKAAEELGYPTEGYPAHWGYFGLAAGPMRNRRMLAEKPQLVVAFHDNLVSSKGTKDMLNAAKEAGVPVVVMSHNSDFKQLLGINQRSEA